MWMEKEESTMTNKEIKEFFERKDVKVAKVVLIVGITFLAYLESNWILLCLLISVFFFYLYIKEYMKERR